MAQFLSSRYPGSNVQMLAFGGENALFLIHGNERECVVKMPISPDKSRLEGAYHQEVRVIQSLIKAAGDSRQKLRVRRAFPNITDYGSNDGIAFVEMDFENQGSLKQNFDSEEFFQTLTNVEDWISTFKRLAIPLQCLHGAGWVHGDVKPKNFLVNKNAVGRLNFRLCDLTLLAKQGKRSYGVDPGFEPKTQKYFPEGFTLKNGAQFLQDVHALMVTYRELAEASPNGVPKELEKFLATPFLDIKSLVWALDRILESCHAQKTAS